MWKKVVAWVDWDLGFGTTALEVPRGNQDVVSSTMTYHTKTWRPPKKKSKLAANWLYTRRIFAAVGSRVGVDPIRTRLTASL